MRLLLCAFVLAYATLAIGQEVRVAAAADLAPSMPELKRAFESEHSGSRIRVSIGSSVSLEMQLENGAPFDVFLSADVEQPRKLINSGKAEAGSYFVYAQGVLALLVPRSHAEIWDLRALTSGQVKKIAIANPQHAPYGRAAVAALKAAGLYDVLQSKIVEGENVAQAAQFVISGNADAGIVSLSAKSLAKEQFAAYPVDAGLYPPLRQAAVLMKPGADKPLAKEFIDFLRSEKGRTILQKHGLRPAVAACRVAGKRTKKG